MKVSIALALALVSSLCQAAVIGDLPEPLSQRDTSAMETLERLCFDKGWDVLGHSFNDFKPGNHFYLSLRTTNLGSLRECFIKGVDSMDVFSPRHVSFYIPSMESVALKDQHRALQAYSDVIRYMQLRLAENEHMRERITSIDLLSLSHHPLTQEIACSLVDIADTLPNLGHVNLMDALHADRSDHIRQCATKVIQIMDRLEVRHINFKDNNFEFLSEFVPKYEHFDDFYLDMDATAISTQITDSLERLDRPISLTLKSLSFASEAFSHMLGLEHLKRLKINFFEEEELDSVFDGLVKRTTGLEELDLSADSIKSYQSLKVIIDYLKATRGTTQELKRFTCKIDLSSDDVEMFNLFNRMHRMFRQELIGSEMFLYAGKDLK